MTICVAFFKDSRSGIYFIANKFAPEKILVLACIKRGPIEDLETKIYEAHALPSELASPGIP